MEPYAERADLHAQARDAQLVISRRLSRARLATVLPGGALVLWALSRDVAPLPLAAGVALLLAFAVLAVWHARVDARAEWHDALRIVSLEGDARVARAWDRLPADVAPDIDLERHPFAIDLDLFGRASLMQWIGPAATPAGTATLHRWLLDPAPPGDIPERQAAVRALAGAAEWREQFAAHGRLLSRVRTADLERFLQWAESSARLPARRLVLLKGAALILTASIWVLILLHATGALPAAFWLLPVLAGIILSFVAAPIVHGEFSRAGAGQHAFARYASLFDHAVRMPVTNAPLQRIGDRLSAGGADAPACLRRLNRILGFAELRSGAGIFHFAVNALTLWDVHVFLALDRWRRDVGARVRGWMDAIGELDALSAFARIRADNPAWCIPDVTTTEGRDVLFAAEAIAHPLIHAGRRVANDVQVGPPGTLLLITGSNMSGKSTLLRAIGLNTVLAQAGAPACARALRLPPIDLETSIRVHDSLEQGLSYFMAALARLKRVVDRAARPPAGRTVLYLLDEILQGTNTAERSVAVRGVARHLLGAGAIGVMTTHDLAVAVEEPLSAAARLVHFTETVDAHGAMSFDYRLRPGLATSRNALRLMELMGIELPPPVPATAPGRTAESESR